MPEKDDTSNNNELNDMSILDETGYNSFNEKSGSNLDISYKFENSRLQIDQNRMTPLHDVSDIDSGVFCSNMRLNTKKSNSVNTHRHPNTLFNMQDALHEVR
jgi:hypothetical protein